MKTNIHPKYIKTVVVCNTCKAEYTLGSTEESIKVELCSNCHPFYTGRETLVDTDNLVDRFNKKRVQASTSKLVSKKEKRLQRKQKISTNGPLTLKDMLSQVK